MEEASCSREFVSFKPSSEQDLHPTTKLEVHAMEEMGQNASAYCMMCMDDNNLYQLLHHNQVLHSYFDHISHSVLSFRRSDELLKLLEPSSIVALRGQIFLPFLSRRQEMPSLALQQTVFEIDGRWPFSCHSVGVSLQTGSGLANPLLQ